MMRALITLVLLSGLAGCSASLDDYEGTEPAFVLRDYFSGSITAWGIVEDYSNQLRRRFCVDIDARWQKKHSRWTGTLHETFYFHDGEQQIRVWKLQEAEDGTITGRADDVVGIASGQATGTAFNWQYRLQVPLGDNLHEVAVDDWMYMLDKHRMMNRSYLSKWGITVAQISIFFDKSGAMASCEQTAMGHFPATKPLQSAIAR